MITIPDKVQPSGNEPKTSQPASVDHTSCEYVNGAMAEADATWKALMNSRWPINPIIPIPANSRMSETGYQA
jgi:hypothetical protein